ncbi:hypothetical protein [Kineosporia succinea]|uniref:Uncharacterized protein n=1 Tax=Kineosporia succinea TaxID=84632 RepID=A0ABT9PDY1_9ACTN|nr:hypothetical protein [Kineosporia succinea]MDP9830921.1 hypothetical protein [Kineosporia succinea]
MTDAHPCQAVRTPFGRFGGVRADQRPDGPAAIRVGVGQALAVVPEAV